MSEAASTPSAGGEEQRAELPKEPLLNDEAPARDSNTAKKLNPKVAPPAAEANATSPEAVAAPAADSRAPPPPNDGRIVIISEAETDEAKKKRPRPNLNT